MERDFNNIRLPWPDWRVVRILGNGSFGRVYEIQKTKDGRIQKAALKIMNIPSDIEEVYSLRADGLNEDEIDTYFRNEAVRLENEIVLMEELQTASSVVGIKDSQIIRKSNEVGYELYIMMELLTSLDKYIYGENKVKIMTVEDVLKMGCNICDALSACEKRNIIHRDIKPSNIFVSEYDEYKLGDFGVSRQKEHTHTNMSLQGTVNYMAPEIYRNDKNYDHTVDIYSLGLVLYRLLNWGRFPFVRKDGKTPTYEENAEALTQRMNGTAEFPDPVLGGTNLANVIRKACNYNPSNRYQRAEDFKNDLLKCRFSLSEKELRTEIIRKDTNQTERARRKPQPSYWKSGNETLQRQPERITESPTEKKKSEAVPSPVTPPLKNTSPRTNPKWMIAGITGACLILFIGILIGFLGNRKSDQKEISVAKEENTPTPIPTNTPTPVPTSTPTPVPTNTPTPVPTSTPTPIPTNTPTPVPTNTPTPIPMNYMMEFETRDSLSKDYVFGNESLLKEDITKISFLNDISLASNDAWDVSELQNRSILAWTDGNGALYIAQNGGVKIKTAYALFRDYTNLTEIDLKNLDTSEVTDMDHMFYLCGLKSINNLQSLDTGNVTNMHSMFAFCYDLTSLDLSGFDTSNVTNMRSMFSDNVSLTSLDLSGFDTSNVTDMGYMFYRNFSLSALDLSSFDTSNVTDMEDMFAACKSLTSLDLSGFNTRKVTIMNRMFHSCSLLVDLNISNFNVSNVNYAVNMFDGCSSLTSYNGILNFSDNALINNIYKDSGLQ